MVLKNIKIGFLVSVFMFFMVKHFCYLGSLVTEDGKSCREVRRRIALENEAFNKKKDLMQKSLSLHLRKRLESIRLECRVIWE